MKLIVVLSIAEYVEQVTKLLHEAGVKRFSSVDITGYKKRNGLSSLNWFGYTAEDAKTNSVMLFSFAPEEITENVLRAINECNDETKDPFPVHAFVLSVDNFSKFL